MLRAPFFVDDSTAFNSVHRSNISIKSIDLTEVSGPTYWQTEAVLTLAHNDRYAVFVQINQIGEVEKKSGGWFKF